MNKIERYVLELLFASLWGKDVCCGSLSKEEWEECYRLSKEQDVVSLIFYGIAPHKKEIPQEIYKQWRIHAFSAIMNNENITDSQSALINELNDKGIPCAVIKGTSLSVCYPHPEQRSLGDIDILIRPEDRDSVAAVLDSLGYRLVETEHSFHKEYYGEAAYVEIHWAVSTFPETNGAHMAKRIMESALDATDNAVLDKRQFPILKPDYQALALILHLERHLTEGGIGLRQLCDWGMYVKTISCEIFEKSVIPVLTQCGLLYFAKVLSKCCEQYLGFEFNNTKWFSDVSDGICKELLADVLRAGHSGNADTRNGVSDMFIERGRQKFLLGTLMKNLNSLAMRNFPVTKHYRILLPIFWVYIPVRYWIRTVIGERKRISLSNLISTTTDRRSLYNRLKLFDVQMMAKK